MMKLVYLNWSDAADICLTNDDFSSVFHLAGKSLTSDARRTSHIQNWFTIKFFKKINDNVFNAITYDNEVDLEI